MQSPVVSDSDENPPVVLLAEPAIPVIPVAPVIPVILVRAGGSPA